MQDFSFLEHLQMDRHTVAVCQIDCGPKSSLEENAGKIRLYMEQAANKGARLVLFPELSLSGYSWDTGDVVARQKATTDEFIAAVSSDARRLNIATVIGIFEEAPGNKVYNTAIMIGPDGKENRYRKMHLPPNERTFAASQEGPVVADFGFVRLGIGICFDNWIPESARMAYLCGAEMLFMPFFWPAEWEVCDDIDRKRTTRDNDAILKLWVNQLEL